MIITDPLTKRECQRKLDGSLECSSPQPEQEDTPKYVQNVMSKSATQDIFSQTQVNIAQSCSRVLNAWNDFLDKYLKESGARLFNHTTRIRSYSNRTYRGVQPIQTVKIVENRPN